MANLDIMFVTRELLQKGNIISETDENIDLNTPVMSQKLTMKSLSNKNERKTLQVLQQTPDNRLTRNNDLQSNKLEKSTKVVKKPFAVFKDPAKCSTPKAAPKKECKHNSSQTESLGCCHCACHEDEEEEENEEETAEETAEEEAFRLMGQEEIPEEYWKDTAETRRLALEESLHENELLYSEVAALRKENRRLSELADNAEYFAKILKDLTEDDKNPSDSEETCECTDEVKSTKKSTDGKNKEEGSESTDKPDNINTPLSSSTPVATSTLKTENLSDDFSEKNTNS